MNKQVFILNGSGRSGKDTFANFLNEYIPTTHYSAVTLVKEIAKMIGWNGEKKERDRKFLSDLKILFTEYNDAPFKDMSTLYDDFIKNKIDSNILIFDIREPSEIERAVKAFNAKTIFIENPNAPKITSNMADANVRNYTYDYIIENDGTLDEFKKKAKHFAECVVGL